MLAFLAMIDDERERTLFEEIYISYRKQMFAVARTVLDEDMDAEDAVHEVFEKLAKKYMHHIKNITCERDRRNYLLKATKNTALNMLRRKKRIADIESSSLDEMVFSGDEKDMADGAFIELLCKNDRAEQVTEAMKSLDGRYTDVIYYHFVLGYTAAQIAELLGRKEDTVKKQLVRGKKLLISALTTGGEQDGDN